MRLFLISLLWMFIPVRATTSAQQPDLIQIGQPIATTVQLPTFGISIDADGVLTAKTFVNPDGRLVALRRAALGQVPGNLARPSANRKVSLVRLLAEIERLKREGRPPTDAMRKLAGLTRVTAAFCDPELGEIVIAGPAEPWAQDTGGRWIGIASGRPTLMLDDLVTALRAYPRNSSHRVFVGCTINPRPEGLAKLVRFQRTIPRSIPNHRRAAVTQEVARGVKESLGSADIKVFGVSPRTPMARVMIEADYRMKRIAVGIEPPPVKLTTYASAITSAGTGMLERWWFTPEYEGVFVTPDHMAVQINGQGVRLQAENKTIRDDGSIVDAGAEPRGGKKPTRATRAFASSFTKRYPDIARASPVYAQLRQTTDWLILAAFFRRFEWYEKARWNVEPLLDESAYPAETLEPPLTAEVVVNAFWKQNRMFAPAGGGVSIEAEAALDAMTTAADGFDRPAMEPLPAEQSSWWWH